QFVMSKEEYIKLFPNDEYDNETDYKSWEKEQGVFARTDSSRSNSPFTIDHSPFPPGFYVIEAITKDKEGQEVKNVKYVELYDEKINKLNHPEYLWTEGSKAIEPGEKTSIKIGSSATNIFLIQQIDKSTGNSEPATGNYSLITINDEKKDFEFSATES